MKKTAMSQINIPNWLVALPAGEYCIPELCERFKLSYHNIYQRFYALNLKSYKKEVNLGLGVVRPMTFYVWKGLEEESARINNMRRENLDKTKKGKK